METLRQLPLIRTMFRAPSSQPNPSPPHNQPPPLQQQPPSAPQPITSPRSLTQLSVLLFGSTLLLASTTLTRRAIHRRHLRVKPAFYAPNTNPHEHFSPFHDAVQALNLATFNCVSLATMGVGGVMWALDIGGLGEARARLRARLGYGVIYGDEEKPPEGVWETLRVSGEKVFVEEAEKKDGEREDSEND